MLDIETCGENRTRLTAFLGNRMLEREHIFKRTYQLCSYPGAMMENLLAVDGNGPVNDPALVV